MVFLFFLYVEDICISSFSFQERIMGNALTAASMSVADVMTPSSQQITKPDSHGMKEKQMKPPLECPMHKSDQFNTINYTSECPIDKMDESEINPLNMVCIAKFYSQ